MRLTAAQILDVTGGLLVAGTREMHADGVWFDSRSLPLGSVFLPLEGERDGHDFIEAAWRAGANGTLTQRRDIVVPEGRFAVLVPDVMEALSAIGTFARTRVGKVVAVTGSAGKTTTKDFLAHVLGRSMRAGWATGSFNNEIGVPLTLANAPDGADVVVVEIGARRKGDVASGARIARPDIGIVTNVGTAHIGVFGSRAAIAEAKGELPRALGADGTAVLNADDALVREMAKETSARAVTFSTDGGAGVRADVRAEGLHHDDDLASHFTLVVGESAAECRLPVAGRHVVSCALAAAAAAHALGLRVEEIAVGLGAATRSTHRMALLESPGGWRVLNDAYNANPESMRAAIDATAHLASPGGRALALVGHMAELGDIAEESHAAIGTELRSAGFSAVVGIGEHSELMAETSFPDKASVVSAVAALRRLAGGFRRGDVILVKASRVVGLESAVGPLLEQDPADTEQERRPAPEEEEPRT